MTTEQQLQVVKANMDKLRAIGYKLREAQRRFVKHPNSADAKEQMLKIQRAFDAQLNVPTEPVLQQKVF